VEGGNESARQVGLITDRMSFQMAIHTLRRDVWSISFVTYSRKGRLVENFEHKFVRIVDPTTGTEFEKFKYRVEESKRWSVVLIGGLYFRDNLWAFQPSVKWFPMTDGYEKINEVSAAVWRDELVEHNQVEIDGVK
jgi:stress response protein SCP2